ncbi:sacsin N-terminal ATP-binding-like domain-containing protein [Candidatus Rariloculus sp.]|uniref:sacsin N-terminal ATP-binding-like domain-containing protein n=1 Tax=Candidatus Rariloculus sp. TaxID=3101265 RepID=UPI003D0D7457
MPDEWDQAKTQILAANTAQGVYKHLRTLESNRSRVLTRWIWELLQNARDVAKGHGRLVASVEVNDRQLTFRHNGRGFQPEEITHLIYYGSTKLERDDTLGQFGSGFLTTHLLSPRIKVSSHLTDGRVFAFGLDRSGATVADLQRHMDASWKAFKSSLSPPSEGVENAASTTFRYPIDARAMEAVAKGLDVLTRSGPYVTVFNHEFKSIRVLSGAGATALELTKRETLALHIERVYVALSELDESEPTSRGYLVAGRDRVAVAVPCIHTDDGASLNPAADAPKLLLGFPLVGTEDFSFPAVVHSLRFSPTEDRDGVFLGQSDDAANLENQAVLEQACRLVRCMIEFAGSSGWQNAYVLADVPPIRGQKWFDEPWLRNCLKTHLVDSIRSTSAVVNQSGRAIAPAAATLLIADEPEGVDQLWGLAADLRTLSDTLPRRSEAEGWCNAVKSWAQVRRCSVDSFDETMDGGKLALLAENAETLEQLGGLLVDEAGTFDWLNKLHLFLCANGFSELLRTLRIVPDQSGRLRTLSELHRDRDIPDTLKDIAELSEIDIRAELRDRRFSVFVDEAGAGDLGPDELVARIIRVLDDRMDTEPEGDLKNASARLFGWIVEHERWELLRGYPAFSDQGKSSVLIRLDRHDANDQERPLAPVEAWPEELRAYADLFPRRHTLAAAFAETVSGAGAWASLEQKGFLRTNVLHSKMMVPEAFLPDEPLPESDENTPDHKADEAVELTDIAFLSKSDVGVLPRVRQSRGLARLFWGFLTQWLVVHDDRAFETKRAKCACGSSHGYFPAAWVVPLAGNQWVPLEGRRTDRAAAQSLANLIRDSDWPTELLRSSPQVGALLSALRVSVPELIMALVAKDDAERAALNETLSDLVTSVRHDWSRLRDLAEDIQDDQQLFEHLSERRKQRRIVRENLRLGTLVEALVKEGLEGEGFTVARTGVGSDFAIELTRLRRTWLLEVKSTRDESVTMSTIQARTAVERGREFLLCVVPLTRDLEDPDGEAVRVCVRFVDEIGSQLAPICEGLDDLEKHRASVTSGDDPDLRLVVESGSPRVRVGSAIWEAGFGLEDLISRLKAQPTVEDNGAVQ